MSKGSDQSVRMCRLVWAIAGRTYHIVENLMLWLKYAMLVAQICHAVLKFCQNKIPWKNSIFLFYFQQTK